MTDVLLINPYAKSTTWASGYRVMPLGLSYIASFLEQSGVIVKALDLNINHLSSQELKKIILRDKPRLVGITATTPMVKSSWQLAELIKETIDTKIVLGGPHPSALPEESASLPQIDFVVNHEGEETMAELTKAIFNHQPTTQIPGISYKKGQQVINNLPRPYIKNLDSLPFPARHLFPVKKYRPSQPLLSMRYPAAHILTSRGCPYGCNFCYKGVFGRTYRTRSVESVLNEWEILVKKYKVKEIEIVDDNFALDVSRAIKICEGIIRRKLVVPWATYSGIRVDHPHSGELIKLMKKAGCYRIAFGVESGSDKVLSRIEKKISTRQVQKAVATAKEAGFLTMAYCMVGNIGEDRQTMQQTVDFAKNLGCDFAQFTVSTPFPGTALYRQVLEEGRLLITDWDRFDNMGGKAFFEIGSVRKDDVEQMRSKAYWQFYTQPRVLLTLGRKMVENPRMIQFFLPKLLSAIKRS